MEPKQDPRMVLVEKFSKFQPIILGFVLLAYVGITQKWPYAGIALIISVGLLAQLYILRANFYIDMSWTSGERLMHRITFFSLAIGLAAFLFHLQSWPGWELLSMISIMAFTMIFLFLVMKKVAITKYLSLIELSSMLLIFIHFMRVYIERI